MGWLLLWFAARKAEGANVFQGLQAAGAAWEIYGAGFLILAGAVFVFSNSYLPIPGAPPPPDQSEGEYHRSYMRGQRIVGLGFVGLALLLLYRAFSMVA